MKYLFLLILLHPSILIGQKQNKISTSINSFGLDAGFYLSDSSDYLISPVSISNAIGMTYLGAVGQTKEQIKKVLYYPEESELLTGFSSYNDILNRPDRNVTITSANKLWAGKGRVQLNKDFVQKNLNYFKSSVEEIDFDYPDRASQTINNWVAAKTEDRIDKLIMPDHITLDAILVLTNAIYFKSNWAKKFDSDLTKKGTFTNHENKNLTVDYMSGKGIYKTFQDEEVNILELPYLGKEFSFLIFLPINSMKSLEEYLINDNYTYWTQHLTERKFELVQIPKFKSSFTIEMNDILSKMGMPNAFNEIAAEFSGIASMGGNIWLSAVIHKTYIEFNEEGTEAAAATGVVVEQRSTRQPNKFIVDKPFIYAIRHVPSNTILFIGKQSNPKY
ncbi:MAG: serpin family protein [Reichenbachiella sp.]